MIELDSEEWLTEGLAPGHQELGLLNTVHILPRPPDTPCLIRSARRARHCLNEHAALCMLCRVCFPTGINDTMLSGLISPHKLALEPCSEEANVAG